MKLESCNPPVVDPLFALQHTTTLSSNSDRTNSFLKPSISIFSEAPSSKTPETLAPPSFSNLPYLSFKSPLLPQNNPWSSTFTLSSSWNALASFNASSNYFEHLPHEFSDNILGSKDRCPVLVKPVPRSAVIKSESIQESDSRNISASTVILPKQEPEQEILLYHAEPNVFSPSCALISSTAVPITTPKLEEVLPIIVPKEHSNMTNFTSSEELPLLTSHFQNPSKKSSVPLSSPKDSYSVIIQYPSSFPAKILNPSNFSEERTSVKRPFSDAFSDSTSCSSESTVDSTSCSSTPCSSTSCSSTSFSSLTSCSSVQDGRIILSRAVVDESRERLRAKRPRLRHEIGKDKVNLLESWYEKYSYLSKEGRQQLADQTGLPVKTVMYWFQNKRRMVKQRTGIDQSTSMARLMKC